MPKERNCKICLMLFISVYNNVCCPDCKIEKPKCIHGTKKGRCKIDGCYGNEICQHKNHNQKCPICKPGVLICDKLNKYIYNFMIGKKIREKTKQFILEYTSIESLDLLYEYLNKTLVDNNLKIDKCHLDHIKPKALFDLKNKNELLECCHYTNLQYIDEFKNLSKGCKFI